MIHISKNFIFQQIHSQILFLSIDGIDLNVGQDFHVLPDSPSLIGDFEIEFIHHEEIFDQEILLKIANSSGKLLVIDEYPVLTDQSIKKIV